MVDGNVRRVIARLTNDAAADVQDVADRLLDRKHPARSNQASDGVGRAGVPSARTFVRRMPCGAHCEAHRHGTQAELPLKRPRGEVGKDPVALLAIRKHGKILLTPSPRVRGFWDLPEPFPGALAWRHFATRSCSGTTI